MRRHRPGFDPLSVWAHGLVALIVVVVIVWVAATVNWQRLNIAECETRGGVVVSAAGRWNGACVAEMPR